MSVATNLLAANVSGIETDATGWTAGANTTRSQNTTRFYAGSKSLQLTATAAGTVSAVTAARVAVTAGDVLTAYAYFSNVVAASGRSTSVTVTWYSVVTGGTAISSVTTAGVTLPNSTAWMTPPPVLITTVPTGATYASVTVTATALTAGASVTVDAIMFGPPNLVAGNLMTYNDQGAEVDATGWQSLWQSAVGRSSAQSFEGWYSLTQTSGAAGVMRIGMVNAVPVTAGTEYFAYAWVYGPVTGAAIAVSVRYYDGTGAQVGVSSQNWTIPAASTWTRRAVIGTAPAGAVSARLVLEPTATASGETWLYDQMAILPAPRLPGNLLGYSAQSIETTGTDWTAAGGCTAARSTTRALEGVASLAITATGGDATATLASPVLVTARQGYRAVPSIYVPALATAPVVDVVYTWLNSGGATLGTSSVRWTMGTTAGWYAPIGSGVAPAGATGATVSLRFIAPTAGTVFFLDNVLIAAGGLGAIADPIPGAYGASISLQGLTTGGYTTWGLWRTMSDGSTTPVRGSSGDLTMETITSDVDIVEDYEAPLGVPVQYMVKLWTGSSYISSTSPAIVLPEPPVTDVVIKDPLQPARWTTAVVETLPDWQRAARQGINAVRGRARPIVISDVRSSRTGSITLVTETAEERDQLWWVLDTGSTLLIQWPSSWHESDMYVSVGDAGEAHIVPVAQYSDREWTAALTEVDRPFGGVVGSADRTWQDVLDDFADWGAVLAGADSWLDVLTGVRGS